jgi:hypothetical protein
LLIDPRAVILLLKLALAQLRQDGAVIAKNEHGAAIND